LGKKFQKARELLGAGRNVEALGLYATLYRQFPQSGPEYGNAAMQSGDLDLGNRILEEARCREPNNPKLLAGLADIYGNWGLHAKYRVLVSEAAAIDSRNLDLQIKLATFLTRTIVSKKPAGGQPVPRAGFRETNWRVPCPRIWTAVKTSSRKPNNNSVNCSLPN